MKKKFNKKIKRIKKITSKIVKDKQLLTIFSLLIIVFVIGCIAIGFLRTFLILASIILIAFIFDKLVKVYNDIKEDKNTKNNKKNKKDEKIVDKKKKDTINESDDDVIVAKKKSKKKKSKGKNKKRNIKTILNNMVTVFLILALLGVIAVIGFMAYIVVSAPDFNPSNLYRKESSIVYSKNNEVIGKLGSEIRQTITFDDMPQVLIDAIIATEDSRYYQHNGVDLPRFMKAAIGQVLGNSGAGGGSTITMQVSKQAYTSGVASGLEGIIRKFTDIYLSMFKLEQKYTKEQILEYYVNIPGLGSNSFGVQEASQTYFGKDVSELSLAESALIAGITKNPTTYNPLINPEKSIRRQNLVLNAMLEQEYISQEEYDQAVLENVIDALEERENNRGMKVFSWFEDALLQQIVRNLTETYRYNEEEAWNLIYSGGLTIYSTLDMKLQALCEKEGTNQEWYNGNEEISIVMTDVTSGAVCAIVGSSQKKEESLVYNRATDAVRQPGSTIKVIGEYAALIDTQKATLGTVIADEPYEYSNGTKLSNSYGTFYGMTTIRDAIKTSSNVVALKAYQMAGEEKVFDYLDKFGITTLTDQDRNEAAAIGGTYNGVTNLEMTAAYNAIANNGRYICPYFYTKITDRNGNVILENKGDSRQVIKKTTAMLLTSAMQDVILGGTGSTASVNGLSLAGKSGTTNEMKDVWFVGFSAHYTCGIWGGHDDNSAQESSAYVKKIWKKS